LDGVTGALVNGNFAVAAGLDLSSAIKQEHLDENLKNIIAVRRYFSPGSATSNDDSSSRNASVSSVKPALRCNPNGPRIGAGALV
ncbi:MetQ/NlpA family ABC transporter substrate-binding protein, partial [Salmonella enterica subsp. enterica serovar Anatum]|nr:MetQ/NlpA family ABC transporter substrate-binding protein [Salmonella enterica subsp. enterica serovar Anatum]